MKTECPFCGNKEFHRCMGRFVCDKCGNRNWYEPGDKIICKECGKKIGNYEKHIARTSGCTVTKKKPMHDEYPWSDTHG